MIIVCMWYALILIAFCIEFDVSLNICYADIVIESL